MMAINDRRVQVERVTALRRRYQAARGVRSMAAKAALAEVAGVSIRAWEDGSRAMPSAAWDLVLIRVAPIVG